MTTTKVKATSILALMAMVSFVSLTLALSIEREPVRVTQRNSGPKYDIDNDKLTPTNPENEQPASNREQIDNNNPTGIRVFGGSPPTGDQQDPQEAFPIGHMTIRRIFLVPMMSPPRQEGDQAEPAGPNSDMAQEQPSPMFPRPLWPFSLSPARHQQPHHHLFGQDEASRPAVVDPKEREDLNDNSPAASGEREGERGPPERPMFDPIKMMIDMMQQAIAGQLAPPETSSPGDLNTNEASDKPTSERDGRKPTPAADTGELDKPMRPTNETKEDIVEIDGKKYLRKTIINRHVGENIIFMTKRLIFTQLNETDSNETPTTTTTTTTTTLKPTDEATEIPVKPTASPAEEPTTTAPANAPATGEPAVRTEQPTEMSTTTTTTTTSEAPVSTSAGDQIASSSTTTTTTTTEQPPEETTTTKDAAEAAKKAAERLTDSTITTN